MKKSLVGILLVMAIAVTACGAAQTQVPEPDQNAPASEPAAEESAPANDTAAEAPASEPAVEEASVEEAAPEEETSTEVVEEETAPEEEISATETTTGPKWYNVDLVDVNTGETFKVNDFQGKVVLIETMAVWCPICTQQQQQTRLLHDQLGERDDFVSLSLDIDPNESNDILKSHVDRYGFNWPYTVVPPEVSREIGDLYGRQYLNPPAAPMLIIDRQGEAHLLPFGVKGFPELQEAVTPFLDEG